MTKNKEFKASYLKELDPEPFKPTEEIGINIPQIQQNIAIQT